ncbi:family 1 glycosylhydrolase [Qipengyuania sediminis]|uniref:family 1 glycosylhydrolase n=1 Tax=Qipengyuania sediminis TaxID=1532023 RepID=UPI00105984C6|nr:family 1 glycosylhydrolase [Qipengyuania sediminis]
MELWGGHECTVNRVGDAYRDQTRLTGHHERIEDLSRFAALGITALRYPALWERIAPDDPETRDWTWTDERVAEIERLGMTPILGLLHHGSGPAYTSLIDDNFVPLFVRQAAATARRYPQVRDWTPINEPLTTARFSALYGVWYPHARDERLFWLALLNQVDATRAAMAAIRAEIGDARLVQTEDLGLTLSTPALAPYAEHYNTRRWASWDLLTGRITRTHPLYERIAAYGFANRLDAIADDPCPPAILGINHYATSDRFLDDRLDAYSDPPREEGFHDIAAVRALDPPAPGLVGVLREAWERYRLPMAVTELHLGCSREEQLRWLAQGWAACAALQAEGLDIRAVTAWALLGNVDWNSLITRDAGHYESGAFDVRGPAPRPTAVARLLRGLAYGEGGGPVAEIAAQPGWWQRPERLLHRPFASPLPATAPTPDLPSSARPIVITGGTGTLGRALARACTLRGLQHVLTDRAMLPIDDASRVAAFLDTHRPWAVINAAGWVRVDDAELEPDGCFRANSEGAIVLAQACAERGIHCTAFSSDLVFDGCKRAPYLEEDAPAPLNVYGESKQRVEAWAAAHPAAMLVIRTAAFFSPHDSFNFAMAVEHRLREGQSFAAAADYVVTPTYVCDLVSATLDLVIDAETGCWHLTNNDPVSWLEFGRQVATALALDPRRIVPASGPELGWRARRPRYAALCSARGQLLPPLADALERHAAERLRAAA